MLHTGYSRLQWLALHFYGHLWILVRCTFQPDDSTDLTVGTFLQLRLTSKSVGVYSGQPYEFFLWGLKLLVEAFKCTRQDMVDQKDLIGNKSCLQVCPHQLEMLQIILSWICCRLSSAGESGLSFANKSTLADLHCRSVSVHMESKWRRILKSNLLFCYQKYRRICMQKFCSISTTSGQTLMQIAHSSFIMSNILELSYVLCLGKRYLVGAVI